MRISAFNCSDVGQLLERIPRPTVIVDSKMQVHLANRSFYKEFGSQVKSLGPILLRRWSKPSTALVRQAVRQCQKSENQLQFVISQSAHQTRKIEFVPLSSGRKNKYVVLQMGEVIPDDSQIRSLLMDIFQNVPIGITVFQLEHPGQTDSLRLIGHNKLEAQLQGQMRPGAIGTTIADYKSLKDSKFAQVLHDVALTGQSQDLGEIVYESPTYPRTVFSCKAFPLPQRCVGVAFENVTQRDLAELNLKVVQEKLQNAQEEERARIARELHDEIGQMLTALKMEIFSLKKYLKNHDLKRLVGMVDQSVQLVRHVSSELRPLIIDDLGFAAAVETYLRDLEKRSKIKCHFECSPEDIQLDPHMAIALFRVFQEGMTNVVRHSRATHFSVGIVKSDQSLKLVMKDNGKGYEEKSRNPRSLGILGMKERVRLLGGSFIIEGRKQQGTRIVVELPLKMRGK